MHTCYTCVSKGRPGKPRRASPHGARARRLTSPGPCGVCPAGAGQGTQLPCSAASSLRSRPALRRDWASRCCARSACRVARASARTRSA